MSCVAETKVVLSAELPRNACDPVRKFAPLMLSEKLPVPMLAGLVPGFTLTVRNVELP